jgi:hypothetical protein
MARPFIEVVEKQTFSHGIKTTPHYHEELKKEPPQFTIWEAVPGKTVSGPFFFDGPVNKR